MKYLFLSLLLNFFFPASITAQDEHLLSSYETTFRTRGKNVPRAHNIRLAVSHIGTYVLEPGTTFSYNEVVGPRTSAAGFRRAPVIIDGQLVQGVGGGVCQVSGTLHAAALYAGMEFVEWHSHSRVSSYIGPGLDATVADGLKDLKFINPYLRRITIKMFIVDNNKVRAEIWSTENPIIDVIMNVMRGRGYSVQYIIDPTLLPGTREIVQPGSASATVALSRTINYNGTLLMNDFAVYYAMSPRIIKIPSQ